ncbi:hypothetical protein QE429_001032 [Bacillus sp. SORGH_AS 510]|uniref:DUF6241 domain-containing protein n=1 Tax=Bacillus sp. SORGH_AS_0510 TaxID=3041771 RepID=UPI0027874CB2|nr:DUF6241 domain-containing protein [Bacillus sp. SORGH_AS_0510]MDQ1144205.1 hypothetical protein [Bacillus sp. SORGH_AS_0510]
MKKVWIIPSIVLLVLIGGIYGANKVINSEAVSGNKQDKVAVETVDDSTTPEDKDSEQTDTIGGIQYDIGIDNTSSEYKVIEVMHKMTHQKVKAEEKWGAIPMIPETINRVYEIVNNSDFDRKDQLLAILKKWKAGNFAAVDDDHNYFWQYQGGTVGQATGILSKAEEETFILNNFGDNIAKEVSSQ